MAEQIIIDIDDINEFWDVSPNISDTKISSGILRAQQADLKPILGDYLYYEFIEDFNGTTWDTAKYQTLFDGEAYTYENGTIYFTGIKPLLCGYAWRRIFIASRINVVEDGQVRHIVEESEHLQDFQQRANERKVIDDTIRLEHELLKYLTTNRTTYPLFNIKPDTEQDHKTSFRFTKV